MPRALVIGYGNPLRGDDGLGWVVAECVAAVLDSEKAEIITTHQLMPELAEPVGMAAFVIFVDASYTGRPGSWKREEIEPDPHPGNNALGHYFTPGGLLAYAQAVYQSVPRALLISIAGQSFDCTEKLTPEVEAVLPEVVRHICEQVERRN